MSRRLVQRLSAAFWGNVGGKGEGERERKKAVHHNSATPDNDQIEDFDTDLLHFFLFNQLFTVSLVFHKLFQTLWQTSTGFCHQAKLISLMAIRLPLSHRASKDIAAHFGKASLSKPVTPIGWQTVRSESFNCLGVLLENKGPKIQTNTESHWYGSRYIFKDLPGPQF